MTTSIQIKHFYNAQDKLIYVFTADLKPPKMLHERDLYNEILSFIHFSSYDISWEMIKESILLYKRKPVTIL